VKPGNVLLGPGGVVKITDFGIAWSASSVPLTQTGQVIGTAQYLSPEQAAGGKAGPASDVYALGAVAYECLTGRRVFDGENSVQIAVKQIREQPDPLPAELPANVRSLVERALTKDPAERFPDGDALLAAVDDVLSGRPPVPPARTRTAVLPVPLGAATLTAAPPSAPSTSGARAAVRVLVGALAVLAVLAVVVLVVRASGQSSAGEGSSGETTTPTTPATVDLVAADLVGRPVRDVQAELVARGLQVSVVPVETGEVPAGGVLSVDPVGSLAPATVVTVNYAVPPVVVPAPDQGENRGNGGGDDKGKGKDKEEKDD
jgi:serine/threonine-protein kinase